MVGWHFNSHCLTAERVAEDQFLHNRSMEVDMWEAARFADRRQLPSLSEKNRYEPGYIDKAFSDAYAI